MNTNIEALSLKNQALLERIADLTKNYENTIADLRVTLTQEANRAADLEERLQREEQMKPAPDYGDDIPDYGESVVEGEVVE